MIHYAFSFCDAVEQGQGLDESLVDAVERTAQGMDMALLLKTRDSLRELALQLEVIALERPEGVGK